MRSLTLLLALLGTLVLSACGGGGAGAGAAEGAQLAPASASFYATVRTDSDSEQFRAALALLERFPGAERALGDFDPERDAEALGPHVDLVVLGEGGGAVKVLLAQPDDPEELEALLARRQEPHVTRELDGWTAVARTEADLDRLERELEAGALADEEDFGAALEGLPEDALVRVFARGGPLAEEADWLAAAALAEDDGVRVEGALAPAAGAPEPVQYRSELVGLAPAGTLAYLSFHGSDEGETALERLPLQAQLALQSLAGLDVRVLAPLLRGEVGVVVRPGAPLPELTLLARVDDPQATLRTLDRSFGTRVQRSGEARRVTGTPLALHYAAGEGHVALSTSAEGLAAIGGEGEPLPRDPRFREAVEASGLPEENAGFVYVNVEDADSTLRSLGALLGAGAAPPRQDAQPLRSVMLYGTAAGGERRFGGFVAIG